jgi:hypothetical protein
LEVDAALDADIVGADIKDWRDGTGNGRGANNRIPTGNVDRFKLGEDVAVHGQLDFRAHEAAKLALVVQSPDVDGRVLLQIAGTLDGHLFLDDLPVGGEEGYGRDQLIFKDLLIADNLQGAYPAVDAAAPALLYRYLDARVILLHVLEEVDQRVRVAHTNTRQLEHTAEGLARVHRHERRHVATVIWINGYLERMDEDPREHLHADPVGALGAQALPVLVRAVDQPSRPALVRRHAQGADALGPVVQQRRLQQILPENETDRGDVSRVRLNWAPRSWLGYLWYLPGRPA